MPSPAHRSTTRRPWWYTASWLPGSVWSAASTAAYSSRTPSKPAATVPRTVMVVSTVSVMERPLE